MLDFKIQNLVLSSLKSKKLIKYGKVSNIQYNFYIKYSDLRLISIFFRLSTFFNLTTLTDIVLYELNYNKYLGTGFINFKKSSQTAFLIIFNQLTTNRNFFVFSTIKNSTHSVDNLFLNAFWLEREYSELYGINIDNKEDSRNLLLAYNDTTAPFKKSFSSIGLFELFFNVVLDVIYRQKVIIS